MKEEAAKKKGKGRKGTMNKGRATVVHPAPPKLSIAKQVSPSIQKKSSMIVDALAKTQSLGATPL